METRLSKTLSYFLRHAPGDADLEMDEQGYVSLESLLEALRDEGWDSLDRESFIQRLDDPEVERFERRGSAVRATYGHSVEVEPDYPEISPEFPLFHGTSPEAWRSIRKEGLKSRSRQYVHLSRTVPEAERVGRRHSTNPVILRIIAEPDFEATFYRAGPVVLSEYLPPEWIELHQ